MLEYIFAKVVGRKRLFKPRVLVCVPSQVTSVEKRAVRHAALEAVALRFTLAAQRLKSIFPQSKQVIASGGALAKSSYWAQTFADCMGQPLILAEEPEASSRGAALLAMEAAGLIPDAAQVTARLGRAYEPNPVFTERYAEMLATQQDYYAKIIEKPNL